LGSGALSASGAASFGTTLAAGTHSITAQYSGDGNFVVNTSAALSQVVSAAPSYTLAANPTTQTVSPGSPGTYVITMTPTGGYDGTVTFTCPAPMPAGITCSFNPTSLSGSTLKTTLTLGTVGPTGALIAPTGMSSTNGTANLLASLSGVGLLGLVLAGDWKKRKGSGKIIILGLLLLAMILGLGCGGGSGSSLGGGGGGGGGGTGGTAAGTYAVKTTATGTAGTNGGSTTPQTVTVTLVVN
jgi:Bacterial Ig-like domain (group 3)